jgi:hypothetical protein
MIAHSGLCGLAHLKAAMPPGSYGPLFAAVLGVTVPKGSVHDARLLIEGQTGSMTIGCVSKQVPCASIETKRANIGTGAVGCFVACLTLGKRDIPRARKRLVPLGRWGRNGEREHQSTHEAT